MLIILIATGACILLPFIFIFIFCRFHRFIRWIESLRIGGSGRSRVNTPYLQASRNKINEKKFLRRQLLEKYPDIYARFLNKKSNNDMKKILKGVEEMIEYSDKKRISKNKLIKAISLLDPDLKLVLGDISEIAIEKIRNIYKLLRQNELYINIPEELSDPISFELMHNPVTCSNGVTFDRNIIEIWINEDGTHPLTRQPLKLEDLKPNESMKQDVIDYKTCIIYSHL
jgi:hypothetical protein